MLVASAYKVDDLQAIPLRNHGPLPSAARNNRAVMLDRDAVLFECQGFENLDQSCGTFEMREAARLTIELNRQGCAHDLPD